MSSPDSRTLRKVYVTGADGFIGSHLVERLVSMSIEVTALCVYNSTGSFGWLNDLAVRAPKNLNLILGDIRDPFFLEQTVKGHDTVFHLASLIAIPYSYHAPQSYVETNILGTLNVLKAVQAAKIGRLIHTSTSEVYGTARFVPITESHPLQGQSPYSASKIGADMLVESFNRSFDLPVVTLRPFNTYGPRQSARAIIPAVISQILAGQTILRLGSTTPTRDFNYVSDTVEAFIAVGTARDDVLGKVLNAGSGREISIGNLVNLIADLLGTKVQVETDEARVRPSTSEVERLLADASALTQATSWASKVPLQDGLKQVIAWHQAQDVNKHTTKYQI